MLDSLDVVNAAPSRRYLADVTQHRIGGFGKAVEIAVGALQHFAGQTHCLVARVAANRCVEVENTED